MQLPKELNVRNDLSQMRLGKLDEPAPPPAPSLTPTPTPTSSPVVQSLPDGSGDTSVPDSLEPEVRSGITAISSAAIRIIICSYFDASPYRCEYWLCVADKESSMRPWAKENSPYVGLFQINIDLHADLISSLGYTLEDMYTATPNAHVAWVLSRSGWYTVPWPVARWMC